MSIVIWFLAPITNPHHPVSKQTFHKNKLIVRGMVIIYTILILFGECFLSLHSLFCIYSASVTAVAAMMIRTHIRLIRGQFHTDKIICGNIRISPINA